MKYYCDEETQHCGKCPGCARNTEASKSAVIPGSDTIPGLNGAETDEYRHYLTCHIGEITQEDWQRFHELSAKYIDALGR